jgi:hypothetical protein
MLNCKQTSQLISQSLDRDLSWKERFLLKLHLLICKNCTRFGQQLKALYVGLKHIGKNVENDVDITLPLESKKRIEKSMDSHID